MKQKIIKHTKLLHDEFHKFVLSHIVSLAILGLTLSFAVGVGVSTDSTFAAEQVAKKTVVVAKSAPKLTSKKTLNAPLVTTQKTTTTTSSSVAKIISPIITPFGSGSIGTGIVPPKGGTGGVGTGTIGTGVIPPKGGTGDIGSGVIIPPKSTSGFNFTGTIGSGQVFAGLIVNHSTISNSTTNISSRYLVGNTTYKIGIVTIKGLNKQIKVKNMYMKIVGFNNYANPSAQITNIVIKDSLGNTIATETSRTSVGGTNNIVKFTFLDNAITTIDPSVTKTYDIFGTIVTPTETAKGGEFRFFLATDYNDPTTTSDASGFVLTSQFPIIYNGLIPNTTLTSMVMPQAGLSSIMYIVAAHPRLQGVDLVGDANKIIEFKAINASESNNVILHSVAYYTTATTPTDFQGKRADVYVNNTVVTQITIGANGVITFPAPITIDPASSITIKVALTTPYVVTPTAGARIRQFVVSNMSFTQVFLNGTTQLFPTTSQWYEWSAGLVLQAIRAF